ncbi:MAG: hypothetical protein U0T83_04110 [Bacteriovoracaceae bacterium]
MNMKFCLCFIFVISTSAYSYTNKYTEAYSKVEFCQKSQIPNFFQTKLKVNYSSRMGFVNHGGIFKGGVCWWHSLFQRNAAYLTYFSPKKPMPTKEEAIQIIKKIKSGKSVVEIPGFYSFYQFSLAYEKEIQSSLNHWQTHDAILKFKWFPALAKPSEVKSKKLKKIMDKLYIDVKQGKVVFQMLQLEGIVAHAWLVLDVAKIANGYKLQIIESNNPSYVVDFVYSEGDSYLNFDFNFKNYKFVPYTSYEKSLTALEKTVENFCTTKY